MDFDMDISGDIADGNSDIGAAVLRRFEVSKHEDHQRLCAAVGAMSQSLKDQSIPLTPVAYFSATTASLDRLSKDPASVSDPVTSSLLAFLSFCVPVVPAAVARSTGAAVCETVVRILGFGSLSDKGVKAGLKCIAGLVVAGDKSSWANLSPSFGAVLRSASDHRPKVRKQSHTCLREMLQSFQKLNILIPASEQITSTFERFLLLAGGSKHQDQTEGDKPKGAMEVLYMLGALKECLPLMAPKSTNIILKYFKTLLGLHQLVVTRGILEVLQAICVRETNGVDPMVLLDLLCSIGLSVPVEQKSGDELAGIARLLYLGMKKVYNLNKEIAIMKLPLVFNSLGDILASEHEEAIHAALEALTTLIDSCIDNNLINQGVAQIKSRKQGIKTGPTAIEKICSSFEGLLGIQYSAVWDLSFQVLSMAFDTIGEASYHLMADVVRSLVKMETLPDEDFAFRKQLHHTIGSAVAAVGPKEFLELLQIKGINDDNAWLLPVLKQHIVGASISFFTNDVLDMINKIQATVPKLLNEGKLFSAKRAEGYVYSLWALLPSFCNYPRDTARSFIELQNLLCDKLCNEPNLRGIVCTSLQTLIQQNRRIASASKQENDVMETEDEHLSRSEIRARKLYSKEVVEENLKVIRGSSSKFLRVFHTLFLESSSEGNGCLQLAVRDFASVSDKKVVRKVFIDSMKELLSLTQEVVNAQQHDSDSMQIDDQSQSINLKRALLLDFSASLMPGLDPKEIDLLFSAVKPIIQDSDGKIQKKAYKILSVILKDSDDFLKRNLDILLELLIASLPCHFQSKRYRLECLYYLVVHILKDTSDQKKVEVIRSFLTEILLALKEANKKTRNKAYDLLVEIGHACEDANDGTRKENFFFLFNMVASGVTSETPHMASAAIRGLARLTYEFSDLIDVAYNLLPSASLLLKRKNREIIKAILGFMKVLVAKSNVNGLNERLSGLVEGLFQWQDGKNHFKSKVKLLLEMLVRKCGLDAVKKVMPEEHMKLLANIIEINKRKERKAKSLDGSETMSLKTSASRNSRWNHTQMFSDFGDDDNEENDNLTQFGKSRLNSSHYESRAASLRSTQRRRTTKTLSEDMFDEQDGDPLDLLDGQTARSALQTSSGFKRKKEPSYDEPEIDMDGRLVVRVDGKRPRKEKRSEPSSDDDDSDSKSMASKKSSVSLASSKANKRRKGSESGWAYTGREYTSKKAGGDFKKSDKLDPYAYWPLDRKLLNRRSERKAAARKGMARVMKKTKRLEGKSASGALSVKGIKLGKKKQKTVSKSR